MNYKIYDNNSEKIKSTYLKNNNGIGFSSKSAAEKMRKTTEERYGKSTREEEVRNYESSIDTWEDMLTKRVETTGRYDTEIEYSADYRPIDEEKIWLPISNIKNITPSNIRQINNAKEKIKEIRKNDFHRRF